MNTGSNRSGEHRAWSWVATLVAESADDMRRLIARALDELSAGTSIEGLVRQWNRRRGNGAVRCAFTVADPADARRKLELVRGALDQAGNAAHLRGLGVFLAAQDAGPARIAVLFPGQGGQYPNMLDELGEVYPLVREVFAQGDEIFERLTGRPLTATFQHAGDQPFQQEESTIHASVMLVNYTLFRLIRACGITPDVLLGQSAGEHAALVASDMWTLPVGLEAIYRRTLRVLEVPAERGGKMASVACSRARLASLSAGIDGFIGLASENCPARITISGERDALQALEERCKAEGVDFALLPVSHGYHSPLIQEAVARFQADLEAMPVSPARIPVLSSVDGLYFRPEVTPGFMAHHLARQYVIPAAFSEHVLRLHDDGVRLFLESGPRAALTAFVSEILGDARPHVACASNHPKIGEVEQFHRMLAAAFAHGGLDPHGLRAFGLDETSLADIVSGYAGELDGTELGHAVGRIQASLGAGWRIRVEGYDPHDGRARLLVEAVDSVAAMNAPAPVAAPVMAAAPAPAVTAAPARGAHATSEIEAFVVAAMAEKTGYPMDLLEPDLDLEADLGIDTVKQVDVLGHAFRHFGVPSDKKLRVRDYNTLRKVVALIHERLGGHGAQATPGNGVQVTAGNGTAQTQSWTSAPVAVATPAPTATPAAGAHAASEIEAFVVAAMAEKTGYPVDLLEPDLDLEADLGIDTVKQVDVLGHAFRHFGVPSDKKLRVRDYNTLRKVVALIHERLGGHGAQATPGNGAQATPGNGAQATPGNGAAHAQPWTPAPMVTPAPAATSATIAMPATTPAPAVMPAAASARTASEIEAFVLAAMAEKTGYPVDLLEPDLDLEADLGIDTVKQVDVLGHAFRHFGVPSDKKLRVRDYNTLRKVVALIHERLGGHGAQAKPGNGAHAKPGNGAVPAQSWPPAAAAVPTAVPAPTLVASAQAASEIEAFVVAAMAEKTGYPVDLLELDLDLEADLGIDTVKQVDVLGHAFRHFGVPSDKKLRVRDYNTLRKMIALIHERLGGKGPDRSGGTPSAGNGAAHGATEGSGASLQGGMTEDGIAALLVAAMAERTGYGPEVLGLDLDLESDLAIDTVKQADVIHQVCQRLGASTPADLRFGELRTLRKVARYLLQRCNPADANGARPAAPVRQPREWRADRFVLRAEPSPLATSSAVRFEFAGKHVVITVDPYGIAGRVAALLGAQGARVTLVYPEDGGHARPDDAFVVDMASPEQLRALVEHLRTHGAPVHGVYHLHALAPAIPFAEIGQAAWERAVEQATTAAMAMAQALYGDFEAARPGETFFVVATQMGGCLGVATETPGNPVCGGHAGFLKSLRRELPGTLAKVVDFDSLYPVDQIARRLVDEVASLNAQVECGYVAGERHVVSLHRSARAAGQAPLAVGPDWVFLISGGGRGVVFETALGLAQQFGCTIYVTGRTPLPRPGSPWLSLTREALAASRNQFFAEQRAQRPQITPRELRSAWDAVLREWELHQNLQRAAAVSSRFHYRVCDVVSASDVRALVDEIRARHGRIDAVVHGAMVEESKSLPQKTDALIRRTIATKVHGAFHLMRATLADRPRLFMNFGSGAGRFGNKGQTDYAAAGDLLVKMTQVYHRTMAPDTRCITIDWPAWSGAGWVANNPNIEELLRDNALATFIDVDEGVAWFMSEMLQGGDAEEVIVAGAGMAEGLGRTLQIADFFEAYRALGGNGSAASMDSRERGAAASEERRWDTV